MNTEKNRYLIWATCMLLGTICHTAAAQFQTNQSFINEVLALVNQERSKNSLNPFRQSQILNTTAQGHSLAMARDNFFAHCNPDTKTTPGDRAKANNYPLGAAENIAAGYATPQSVMTGWMNSPGHRRNILNANYTEIGIGYVLDQNDATDVSNVDNSCNREATSGGPYRHYWTQNFGTANTTGTVNYTIGGRVNGLSTGSTLVLRNNGSDTLTVSANGNFTFATAIANNSAYAVSVITQPNGQTCSVSNASGTTAGANVSNVNVSCTDNAPAPTPTPSRYNIGGRVSGLGSGKTLVLRNNDLDTLTINANGSFAFLTTIASGSPYAVSVATQPNGQTCSASNASGTIANTSITNVNVTCVNNAPAPAPTPSRYNIGGRVSGLGSGKTLVLRNNGLETLTIHANGSFAFLTTIASGSPYAASVATQPTGQTCTVDGASGTVNNTNITDITVTCTNSDTPTAEKILNGLSGTWYDPAYSGSGFNVIQTPGGFLMYFYGYKGSANGESQWLLSEAITTPIRKGQTVTTRVFSGFTNNGGSFTTKPTTPYFGLTEWGQAQVTINSCRDGVIQLTGNDGSITHNIQPLATIDGLACTESDTETTEYSAPSTTAGALSSLSGTWYDPAYSGSGFNVIQTAGGALFYFYGYKGSANGSAQWLLSEAISNPIRKGQTFTIKVFSGFTGNGGNFTTKPTAPHSGLTNWGQAQVTINSCRDGIIQLTGNDGTITHNIVPLATINGVSCTE